MKIQLLIALFVLLSSAGMGQTEKSVLVFTKNGEGYIHDNIEASVKGLIKLSEDNGFAVEVSDDASVFTEDKLKNYDALIFSNTNNKVFDNDDQKLALIRYVEAGGGFVGIHSACATERDWPWFWALVGGKFIRHAPFQEFTLTVIDAEHASTSFIKSDWVRADECYYVNEINPDIHVLLAADMNTIEDEKKSEYPANIFGDLFPISWCHEFDGGRQWFSSLGHSISDYSDPAFMKHLLGGIIWAMENGKPDYSKAYSNTLK